MSSLVALYCLSLTIFHEARSEHFMGQMAVANVVLNRAEKKYGKEKMLTAGAICSTMAANKQFSFANGKLKRVNGGWRITPALLPKEEAAWQYSVRVAKTALSLRAKGNAPDFSKGATHYHTTYVSPYWKKAYTPTTIIGGHIFYKEK